MGEAQGGSNALLDLEELLATRLLVQGNSGSGKSHLLRRLLEKSAGQVQQIVIDPEGDFVTLAERYGHLAIEAADDAEAKRVFTALGEGGSITMPLMKTFWTSSFGMLTDKFGVPWMVNVAAQKAPI